jgi:hypothetical protein
MATDLVISFLSSVPPDVLAKFEQRPLTYAAPAAPLGQGKTFYAGLLQSVRDGAGRVIPGFFKKAGGQGPIGRVAVMGFSNGVDSGVSQMLESSDAQKIDTVLAFDGVHGSFAKIGGVPIKDPVSGLPLMQPAFYKQWIAAALRAAAQRPSDNPKAPVMVVTHSSIEPDFPSTTETANLLWNEVLKQAPGDYESLYWDELDSIVYPGGLTMHSVDTAGSGHPMPAWTWQSYADGWYDRRVCNGLSIFGWGEPGMMPQRRVLARCRDTFNNTADHLFQAKGVLPGILETYLVKRWNPTCGSTSGLGGGGCEPGDGASYDEGPDGPLPDPVGVLGQVPQRPIACPYPPPGASIHGAPGDPCALVNTPPPPVVKADDVLGKLLAVAAGGAAGFLGARWAAKRMRSRGARP